MTAPTPRHGLGAALLWACFLGCSWTWVIGMFLPIMLLRDFGVWGWVVFAVPNVVGAAAMGFVLRTPAISYELTQKHAKAMQWFAGVTVAYQVYVVSWLFPGLWLALVAALPWLILNPARRERLGAWLPAISVGVAVVSWGAFSMANQLDGAWLDVGFGPERDVLPSPWTCGCLRLGWRWGFSCVRMWTRRFTGRGIPPGRARARRRLGSASAWCLAA